MEQPDALLNEGDAKLRCGVEHHLVVLASGWSFEWNRMSANSSLIQRSKRHLSMSNVSELGTQQIGNQGFGNTYLRRI